MLQVPATTAATCFTCYTKGGRSKVTPELMDSLASVPGPLLLTDGLLGGGLLWKLFSVLSGPEIGTFGELLILMSAGLAWNPTSFTDTCVGITVIRDGACTQT